MIYYPSNLYRGAVNVPGAARGLVDSPPDDVPFAFWASCTKSGKAEFSASGNHDLITQVVQEGAIYFDADGVPQQAQANQLRIGRPLPIWPHFNGAVIEPTRTNLVAPTTPMSGLTWSGTGTTLNVYPGTAWLRNLQVGRMVVEGATTGVHNRSRAIGTLESGKRYTFWVVVSSIRSGDQQRHLKLKTAEGGAFSPRVDVFFNLVTGATSANSGVGTQRNMWDLGGGLWLCLFTAVASSSTSDAIEIYSVLGNGEDDESFAGDPQAGLVVHHVQVEQGDGPTSPIINGSITGTPLRSRNADQIAWSGDDFGGDAFTLFFRMAATWPVPAGLAEEQTILDTLDGSIQEGIRVYNSVSDVIVDVYHSGSPQNDNQFGVTTKVTEQWALGFRCAKNDMYSISRLMSDGQDYTYPLWLSGDPPISHDKLAIGQSTGNAPFSIADIVVYQGALDDTQMDAVLDWLESRKDL